MLNKNTGKINKYALSLVAVATLGASSLSFGMNIMNENNHWIRLKDCRIHFHNPQENEPENREIPKKIHVYPVIDAPIFDAIEKGNVDIVIELLKHKETDKLIKKICNKYYKSFN